MDFSKVLTGIIVICIILTILPCVVSADDCEIIFPDTPPLNLDSIAELIPGSFLDVVLTTAERDTLVQPGYLIDKDGKMLTCRSAYLESSNCTIRSSDGETLKIVTKLAEDALADVIMLKIAMPKQKMEYLEPRYYFPDIGETLAAVSGSNITSSPLNTIQVFTNGDDPLYGFVSRLEDSDDKSLHGKMAVNYDGRVLGIIHSIGVEGGYRNFLFPFSIIHIDGPRQSSHYFITKFSSALPDTARTDLLAALQLYWSSEFSDAHAALTDVILKYPVNPLVLLYSAYCELQIGNVDVAIGKANEAIELGHGVAELYLLIAKCYEQIFKPKLARAYADSAHALNQSNIDALMIIGRSFLFRGEIDESWKNLQEISRAQEDNTLCMSLQAMLKAFENKYDEACELINRALSISRSDVKVYLLVYTMQTFKRHSDKALEALRKAIEIAPADGWPHFYLGNHFCIEQELDSAIASFKTAIKLSPNLFNAYLNLGLLLYEEKRYEEAIEYLHSAKDIYPDNETLLRNLGTCYARLEKYEEALAEFKNALTVNPKSRITNYNTGLVYMDMEDYDMAKEHFDKAYEFGYRHSNLYFQQGKLFLALGDTAESKKYYEKLRSISTAAATKLHNLIIGRDDYAIDSILDLKLKKMYENITPSLVNAECIGFLFGRPLFYNMVYHYISFYDLIAHWKTPSIVSWGCQINNQGDIFVLDDITSCSDRFLRLEPAIEMENDTVSKHDYPRLDKSKSRKIAGEFVIFSVQDRDSNIVAAPIAKSPPSKGDSILVITNPIGELVDYSIGKILGVNPDPYLGNIIIIETPFEIDRSQGLLLNMDGELAGFLTSIKIPGTNLNFAIWANEYCRFYYHGRFDPSRFNFEMSRRHKQGENFEIGQVYLWLGNYSKAREAFEAARNESAAARDPEILTYLAFIEWKDGNLELAREYFKKNINWNPNNYEAFYLYGLFLMEQNDPDEAEKNFKLAIRHNKYHAMAHFQLGEMYIASGKADKARDEYEDLKKLDPAMAEKLLGK